MSSRTVFVFWDSSKNPHKNAKDYCECVQTAPAVKAGCIVDCRLIDVLGNDSAKRYWSGNSTIEVVSVKNGATPLAEVNPSFLCNEIHAMVAGLCR